MNSVEPVYSGEVCTWGIDKEVYPLEATMKTAYMFLDRCYVFLFHDTDGMLRVRLKLKSQHLAELSELGDEFMNELLNQSVRHRVATETKNLRELIMARALYSGCLETTLPDEPVHDEGETFEADTLGICKDWFEQGRERGLET